VLTTTITHLIAIQASLEAQPCCVASGSALMTVRRRPTPARP
jgi:hypothetical protein